MYSSNKIKMILEATTYWHGTGRFQYDRSSVVVDVLSDIAAAESLIPKLDLYDLGTPMTSISLAKSREYGLMYADMHAPDPNVLKRNVLQRSLVKKYIRGVKQKAIAWHLLSKGLMSTIRLARTTRRTLKTEQRWSKKINKSEPSIVDSFTIGSDIPNNYPVLFGISLLDDPLVIAPYLDKHEVRFANSIPMSDVTHIEVPMAQVAEVEKLLINAGIALPVIAIESVESVILTI